MHCGGFIGKDKNLICSRLNCATMVHQKNRFEPDVDTLFAPAPQSGRCYCTPSVLLTDFDSEVVQAFLLEPRENEEMRRIFSMFTSATADTVLSMSREELEDFVGGGQRAEWVPTTPREMKSVLKKPRGLFEGLEAVPEHASAKKFLGDLESVVNGFSTVASPASEDPTLFMISEFPKIHSAMGSVLELVRAMHGLFQENKDEVDHGMMVLMKKLQTSLSGVYSTIGNFNKEESTFQDFGNDLTSVVAGLGRCLLDIQDHLGISFSNEAPPAGKKRRLLDRVNEVERQLEETVLDRMEILVTQVIGLKATIASGDSKAVRFESMDEDQEPSRESSDANARYTASLDMLFESMTAARDKIDVLETSLSTLRSEKSDFTKTQENKFKVAGMDLSDPEVGKRLLAGAGVYGQKPGFFYDCFSMGNYCVRADSDDQVRDRAAAASAKLSLSVHDLSVTLSFGLTRPPQFGQIREIQRAKSPKDPTFVLPRVKSFEQLYDPDTYQVTVMSTFEEGHRLISNHLNSKEFSLGESAGPRKVLEVARIFNDLTIRFMHDLKSQVEFFYRRITLESLGATATEAWALVSEMLAAVLAEIYTARTELFGSEVFEEDDPGLLAVQALTNTFRAHAKMHEIRTVGFSKHHCVVPALSLHLFGRKASIHSMLTLQEQMVEVKKLMKTFETAQPVSRSELDTRFGSLKGTIEKLAREVEKLGKDVKALQGKKG